MNPEFIDLLITVLPIVAVVLGGVAVLIGTAVFAGVILVVIVGGYTAVRKAMEDNE